MSDPLRSAIRWTAGFVLSGALCACSSGEGARSAACRSALNALANRAGGASGGIQSVRDWLSSDGQSACQLGPDIGWESADSQAHTVSDFAPQPPPSIISLQPNPASMSEPLKLTVRGRNFRAHSKVQLGSLMLPAVSLASDLAADATTTLTVTLQDPAVLGRHSVPVSVLNSDGSRSQDGATLGLFYDRPKFQYSYPAIGGVPLPIGSGDFDGDGNLDIVTADCADPSRIAVYFFDGHFDGTHQNGRLGLAITDVTLRNPDPADRPIFTSLTTGDWDGDGRLDLALAQSGGFVRVMYNTGYGYFWHSERMPAGDSSVWVAADDLNRDGRQDIVSVDRDTNRVSVFLGRGAGQFSAPAFFSSGGLGPSSLALADVNQDGALDLVLANSASGTVVSLLGDGAGNFKAGETAAVCSAPAMIAVKDLNRDGLLDIVTSCPASDELAVLLSAKGTSQLGAVSRIPLESKPYGLALADVNGDGYQDIIAGHLEGKDVSILLGSRTRVGAFETVQQEPAGSTGDAKPAYVMAADLNNDQVPDIAASVMGWGGVGLLISTY